MCLKVKPCREKLGRICVADSFDLLKYIVINVSHVIMKDWLKEN